MLINGLSDEDPNVRKYAAFHLGQRQEKQAMPFLLETLEKEKQKEIIIFVAQAIIKTADETIVPELLKIMESSENPLGKAYALYCIGQLAKRDALELLIESLSHKEPEVRTIAAWALLDVIGPEDKKVIGALMDALLLDPDPQVRRYAARTLGYLKAPITLPALASAMDDRNRTVRKQVAWALGNMGQKEAIPILAKGLMDVDPEVKKEVVYALAQTKDQAATPYLIQALQLRQDIEVQKTALRALGQIGDGSAVTILEDFLSEEVVEVRREAAKALAQLAHPSSTQALVMALADPDKEVRISSAKALIAIKDASIVPKLINLLAVTREDESIVLTLQKLTGQNLGRDYTKWLEWYNKKKEYMPTQEKQPTNEKKEAEKAF